MIFLIFYRLKIANIKTMTFYSFFVQAIGFIPSFISILSIQLKDRKKLILLQLSSGIMWVTHYFLLGAYTAVLTNFIGIFRSILAYYNDKRWARSILWLLLIILLSILSSFLTWAGWISILPSISLICTATGLWVHNLTITRILFLISSPCLLIYDIKTGSWGCTIIEIIAFISFVFAIIRLDIIPYLEKRKNREKKLAH